MNLLSVLSRCSPSSFASSSILASCRYDCLLYVQQVYIWGGNQLFGYCSYYDTIYLIIWYKLQMNQTDFQYTKLVSKTKCLFEEWFFFQLPWFKEAVTIDTTVYLRIHDGYQKTVSSEMDSRDITNCLISWKLYHILVFPPFFYIYIDSVHENVIYVSLKSDIYRLVDRNLFLCIYLIK